MGGGGKGGGKGKKGVGAIADLFIPGLGQFITALSYVWTAVSTVYSTFESIYNWTAGVAGQIWGVIRPLYDFFRESLWPYVKWIVGQVNTVFTFINDIFRKINSLTDTVFNGVLGPLNTLWKNFTAFRDEALRLISIFDRKLAQEIYRVTETVRAETIGRIEGVYALVMNELEKVKTEVLFRLKTFTDFFTTRVAQVETVFNAFKKLQDTIVEKEYTLRGDTVIVTSKKYGDVLLGASLGITSKDLPPIPIEEWPPEVVYRELDIQIATVDAGTEGTWGDVALNINDYLKFVDKEADFPEMGLDLSLLSEDDRKTMEGTEGTAWDIVRGETDKESLGEEE